jgi:hypothetical protein
MEDKMYYQTPNQNLYQSYINNIMNDNNNSEVKSTIRKDGSLNTLNSNQISNHSKLIFQGNQPDQTNQINNQIPRSSQSENSFKDFLKICKAYYKELKNLFSISTQDNLILSQDDFIVLNDLIKEVISYTNILVKNSFFDEIKKLIKMGEKICDMLLKILNRGDNLESSLNYKQLPNQISNSEKDFNKNYIDSFSLKINYSLSMKLQILEIKFDYLFNSINNYEEAEKVLLEIIKIQNILQLSKFNLACSNFYLAMIKFCKS